MRHLIYSLFVVLMSVSAVNAQFTFDRQRLETIRWSPLPETVSGIKNINLDLNGNWNFNPSPEESFWKNTSVKNWKTIEVPGEWVMQGFDVEPGKYAGYQRSFILPEEWAGFRIKLKCEAVYSECSVWVNGKSVGSHIGGFTAFEIDVTDVVKKGENNLALAVRSESIADTLSSASKYAVHPLGGISRPIYLVALPEVNIASFHVRTNFDEKYEDADLHAEFTISNETAKQKDVTLNFKLTDASNQVVSFGGVDQIVFKAEPGNKKSSTVLKVKKPAKWDPEHPNLYRLHCSVMVEGKETATVVRRFGFKQTEVRGNQVFVNNHPIKLKGVCRHEVHPLRGRSLVGEIWEQDVRIFKEGNVNYIRTSHYPPNQKLLEACDELGMFVEVEAPYCWGHKGPVNNKNYFEAIIQPELEMVEMYKSHPSVLHWSIGNESEHFNELYKEAADLVKQADPSRPRVFSQYGPDGDSEYLEIGNHHYPGPGGPDKYRNSKRPITFDEYVHLNAYNRFELMTDPGVRDFWGDILYQMWEKMYYSKGVLGGALWAGIDDTFFLPSGHAVGYGTWGPIDGWRRPKPEYWHMKKIYSPVKITLLVGAKNESVKLSIENRYFFSNLNECRIEWKNNETKGLVETDAEAGKTAEITLPFSYAELGKFTIDVFKDNEVAVDQYAFDFSVPKTELLAKNTDQFKWSNQGGTRIAESKKLKVKIGSGSLLISDAKGNEIINGWPVLMLVSGNNHGDTQMTKDTPDYDLYSPEASNRSIRSVELEEGNSEFTIILTEGYDQATGSMKIKIQANGEVLVSYDYSMLKNENFRQWGIAFSFPEKFNTLSWEKKGLWSVYPEDHIGRLKGEAKLFYNDERCGLAGPSKQPSWAYNQDQTRYGSNDFRSTKRNVYKAALVAPGQTRVGLKSDGSQHVRSWLENGQVHWLVAGYDNPGFERFLRGFSSHAQLYDIPLIRGQKLSGQVKLLIQND